MSDLKLPTVGRIVHYYPNGADPIASANNAFLVPAIVVQAWGGSSVNLQVFTMNGDAPNVLRYSIDHVSNRSEGELKAYWDWPEIK